MDDIKNLKKYILWKSEDNRKSCLLEKVYIDKYTVHLDRIYLYDHGDNSEVDISKDINRYEFSFGKVLENIEYQSNSLKDCMGMIEIIKNKNKYNI